MAHFADVLLDAGGVDAPTERSGQLRALLAAELDRSRRELELARSGYELPVTVVVARDPDRAGLISLLPVAPELRADVDAVSERAWWLTAALLGAVGEAGATRGLEAGAAHGLLALRLAAIPGAELPDPELAALAFEEHVAPVDRLRARALAVPAHLVATPTTSARPSAPPTRCSSRRSSRRSAVARRIRPPWTSTRTPSWPP